MAQDEAVLLRRFVTTADAGAFAEIVRRYASLVYSASVRILGNRETAADATQDTFFQLLKKADTVTGSLPAWLHRVATGKAVDKIRTESARRRAEAHYADVKCHQAAKWEDLSPHVDRALDALDAASRELLIAYFLEGRSTPQIAAERGLSRSTVSRQIDSAVGRLRGILRQRGVIIGAAALSSLLAENAAQAVPAAVLAELAKMALAGAKLTGPAAVGGLLVAAKAKIIVVAAVVGIGAVGVLTHRHYTRPVENSNPKIVVAKELTKPDKPPVSDSSEVEGIESAPPDEPIQSNVVSAEAPTQPPEPGMEEAFAPEPTQDTFAKEDPPPEFDLSSPHATVTTLIRMFAVLDSESVMACIAPNGTNYHDVQSILQSQPGELDYDKKLCFQAFDPDAEMPVVEQKDIPDGVEITWLITFRTEFVLESVPFAAGEQVRFAATVVPVDGRWLIDSLRPDL